MQVFSKMSNCAMCYSQSSIGSILLSWFYWLVPPMPVADKTVILHRVPSFQTIYYSPDCQFKNEPMFKKYLWHHVMSLGMTPCDVSRSLHWCWQRSMTPSAWWHHQMETFSMSLAICAGNSPLTSEFPAQRPVMRSFDVFFDLHLNKRLSKQWWSWWFEMLSCPFWHHCNRTWLFRFDAWLFI